jgi:hypothetical protein
MDEILLKTGLLCIQLTKDYFRESYYILNRIQEENGESFETKFKRKELDSNLDIGSFIVDTSGKKYYKILQLNDEDEPKIHAFIDIEEHKVYKPRTANSANRKLGWKLDDCLRFADWRGNYLNADP